MDDYTFKFRDIRAEKANAMSKYKRIKKIAAFFRLMELLLAFVIVSRFSAHLASNFTLKIPMECFERISAALISPRFVFLIGNSIVGFLILKSYSRNGDENPDFYEEYVEKCRNNIVQEKKIITPIDHEHRKNTLRCHDHRRKISRSKSDQSMVRALQAADDNHRENGRRELRRTVTEKSEKSAGKLEVSENSENCRLCYKEDGMSSDEFRRTVEAFIARQQRFLREE